MKRRRRGEIRLGESIRGGFGRLWGVIEELVHGVRIDERRIELDGKARDEMELSRFIE